MSKKILIPSLLLSLLLFIGASFLTPTKAQTESVADIQAKIVQVTTEISTLMNEKDNLIRTTITSSGCTVLTGSFDPNLVSNFLGIPYQCPAPAPGSSGPSAEYIMISALRLINPRLLEYSDKIAGLNEVLQALIKSLAIAQAAATTQTSSTSTNVGDDAPSLPPPPPLTEADEELLTFFDPIEAEVIIEEYETIVPDPRVQIPGPNGPVTAIIYGDMVFLTEEVVLGAGDSLEIPQVGVQISRATPVGTSPVEVRLPGGGSLMVELPHGFKLTVIANKKSFYMNAPGLDMEVFYKTSEDGDITLLPGAIFDPISGLWRSLTGQALSTPESVLHLLTGTPNLTCPEGTTLVNACLESCMRSTVEVCLECTPPLDSALCSKPTDKTKFCEQACKTSGTAMSKCAAL